MVYEGERQKVFLFSLEKTRLSMGDPAVVFRLQRRQTLFRAKEEVATAMISRI